MSKSPRRSDCTRCGRRCRTTSGLCGPCQGLYDPIPLSGGRWVVVGGVKRWKPWSAADIAERTRRAQVVAAEQRRRRLVDLVAERYGPADWWKSPEFVPATRRTGRARLDDALADSERYDSRAQTLRDRTEATREHERKATA